MKKLVVSILILAMVSSAYATYGDIRDDFKLWMAPGGGLLSVRGLSTASEFEGGIYDVTATIATFSDNPTILPDGTGGNAAGSGAAIIRYSGAGYDGFDFGVGDPMSTDPVDAMDWFTIGVTNLGIGDVLSIYEYVGTDTTDLGTMLLIPEPMTVALLGLGALFLRRRR